MVRQKQFSDALRLVNFGFWLNPDDFELRYQKLRIYASLFLTDNFFMSLKDNFTESERFNACKRLHVDSSLKKLWIEKEFEEGFKKLCL